MANSDYFAHEHSIIEPGAQIGKGTRIWAFSHVLAGAIIGEECNVCDHTFIENGVVLGNRVTVKCGVYLWEGVVAEDDVFIGPAAVFTNDIFPRSKRYPKQFDKTLLKQGSSIGAGAIILAGTEIGSWSLVGAGSVVTNNVPNFAVVWGNPARFRYWVCSCNERLIFDDYKNASCSCGLKFKQLADDREVQLCL